MARRPCPPFVGLAVVAIRPCAAQEKPYAPGPIRLVVAAPPGGPVDVVARLLAQYLPAILGQPSFVENKAGAGGIIATRAVASATADGLTVLSAANSMLAAEKSNSQAGYHVERDLLPVLSVGWTPNIIVATPALPVSSLKELIELSRTRDLNYGTLGTGTTTDLMTEFLLNDVAHTKIQHIVYTGSAAALTAVVGNQLDVACVVMIAAVPLVQTNQVKAIAVTSNRRVGFLANVPPTLAEAGFPGTDYVTWVGLLMPANTPLHHRRQLRAMAADDATAAPLVLHPGEYAPDVRRTGLSMAHLGHPWKIVGPGAITLHKRKQLIVQNWRRLAVDGKATAGGTPLPGPPADQF